MTLMNIMMGLTTGAAKSMQPTRIGRSLPYSVKIRKGRWWTRREHETQDAERGRGTVTKAHCAGDGLRGVGEELLGRVGRALEREPNTIKDEEQNAEIVGHETIEPMGLETMLLGQAERR